MKKNSSIEEKPLKSIVDEIINKPKRRFVYRKNYSKRIDPF